MMSNEMLALDTNCPLIIRPSVRAGWVVSHRGLISTRRKTAAVRDRCGWRRDSETEDTQDTVRRSS